MPWGVRTHEPSQRSSGMLLPSSHSSSPSTIALPQAALTRGAIARVVAWRGAHGALAEDLAGGRARTVGDPVGGVTEVAFLGRRVDDRVTAAARGIGAERAVVAHVTEVVAVRVFLAWIRDVGTVVDAVPHEVAVAVRDEGEALDGLAVETGAARAAAVEEDVDRAGRAGAEGPDVAQQVARRFMEGKVGCALARKISVSDAVTSMPCRLPVKLPVPPPLMALASRKSE